MISLERIKIDKLSQRKGTHLCASFFVRKHLQVIIQTNLDDFLQSTLFRTAKHRSKKFLLAILFEMIYDYIEQMFVFADSVSTLPAI